MSENLGCHLNDLIATFWINLASQGLLILGTAEKLNTFFIPLCNLLCDLCMVQIFVLNHPSGQPLHIIYWKNCIISQAHMNQQFPTPWTTTNTSHIHFDFWKAFCFSQWITNMKGCPQKYCKIDAILMEVAQCALKLNSSTNSHPLRSLGQEYHHEPPPSGHNSVCFNTDCWSRASFKDWPVEGPTMN